MYKIPKYAKTRIDLDNTREGETIENKVTRLVNNKEPIKDGVPIIFQDRAEGVNAAYNIRTDRWEIAVEAMEKIEKAKAAKRDDLAKAPEAKMEVKKNDDGGPEPTHGKAS
ncbi:MAG: hypothetical protein [Microviridae sp.]|nr:MAG: hypothetical protein [Microviridae sp.]